MYGDVLFAAPCEQTIKAMAKTTDTPIYHYLYAHPGINKIKLWIFIQSNFFKAAKIGTGFDILVLLSFL
jgi:hypothetical protein